MRKYLCNLVHSLLKDDEVLSGSRSWGLGKLVGKKGQQLGITTCSEKISGAAEPQYPGPKAQCHSKIVNNNRIILTINLARPIMDSGTGGYHYFWKIHPGARVFFTEKGTILAPEWP